MYRKEIDAYIDSHKEQLLEDVSVLCRINSERMESSEGRPYGEGPYLALQAAARMMEGYGFSVKNYDNYVATADLNDKEPQLDILAHLDVVPAGEGWSVTEPFEPVVKDGKIYGRGTADDKGPAVAALYAMRAVKELDIPLRKNVRLILGTDEECGSSDIEVYYSREKEAPMTFSPDAAFPVINIEKGRIPGEFTSEFQPSEALPRVVELDAGTKVNVVPGKANVLIAGLTAEAVRAEADKAEKQTGVSFHLEEADCGIKITAEGAGAHASTPQEGKNALTALLALLASLPLAACELTDRLNGLVRLFPHGDTSGEAAGIAMSDEISGELTLAFTMLKIENNRLEGALDCRSPICTTEENGLEVLRRNMAKEKLVLKNDNMNPPHHVDGNSHFVRTLLKAYEDYTGQKGKCKAIGGGTYVHHLQNGVAFGASMPGTDNRMHGADEFAVVDELLTSAKIFAQVIVELCG